ncbi:hypothetical protein AB0J83_24505 [Actinoplanes sp. NPDC049596]|uniref:hypothetical protein n=1 Tax=unclassified Actinoplanes TaxID=2626549 RepID=UPI003427FEB8
MAPLIFLGALVAVLLALTWLTRRVRRSGAGTGLMGPIDELYNPGAHRSRQQLTIQDQRMEAPASDGDMLRTKAEPDR